MVMATAIEMFGYYRKFQEARVKQDQKKRALDRLNKAVQNTLDEKALLDLREQIKVAEAEYKVATEEAEDLWSLAMTGQHKRAVEKTREVEWFTPWGRKITKQ